MDAVRVALALAVTLTLPGWALLAAGGQWRGWAPLQRWCLAVCLSLAVYPVLFYGARLAPGLTLGPLKLGVMLAACGLWALWRLRGQWRAQVAFDRLECLALGLVALTLVTRFWIVRTEAYPAWSDSLHHTLLTALTAAQGRLPHTLEPYFPIPLAQYHLGLYAFTGSVQMLSGAPAHSALLWSAQALNGLCGLGVYLVLDRKVGRLGALTGLVVIGLLSRMPAWYVNWGRYTQLAGQTLMLAAWLLTWEALSAWRRPPPGERATVRLWGLAALLTAATFLLHFRVAVFAAPLYLAVGAWELWHARRAGQTRRVLVPVAWMGALTLLLVGPVLPEAMTVYLSPSAMAPLPADQATQARATYFEFPLSSVEALAGPVWLVVLSALAALLGVWRRSRLALLTVGWVLALLALGYAYLLNVPVLNLTNLGAVLIMLYLPMGFLLGAAVQALMALALARGWRWARGAASALVVAAALLMAPLRVSAVEPFRFFVTPADVPAMAWISEYTPPDALFAVNTTFWLPRAPHGTDAGYWIPYFTGRSTTASAMLLAQGQPSYVDEIVTLSHAEERLENDPAALEELRALGVDYIYIGARGDFSGPGLEAATLREEPGVSVVYEQAGVTILALGSR